MDITLANYRTAGASPDPVHLHTDIATSVAAGVRRYVQRGIAVSGYQALLDELEDFEAVYVYQNVKALHEEMIPFDTLMAELDQEP